LIIVSNLLMEFDDLKEAEVRGAEKMLFSFTDALMGEMRIAHRASEDQNFEKALAKVEEAVKSVHSRDYEGALRRISEAISHATTSGQWAVQALKEKGCF